MYFIIEPTQPWIKLPRSFKKVIFHLRVVMYSFDMHRLKLLHSYLTEKALKVKSNKAFSL